MAGALKRQITSLICFKTAWIIAVRLRSRVFRYSPPSSALCVAVKSDVVAFARAEAVVSDPVG